MFVHPYIRTPLVSHGRSTRLKPLGGGDGKSIHHSARKEILAQNEKNYASNLSDRERGGHGHGGKLQWVGVSYRL